MPYIMSDKRKLKAMSDDLNEMHTKMSKVSSDFASINKRLDWDIESKVNIEARIKKAQAELESQIKSMSKLSKFLITVIEQYDKCEKNMEVESETLGDSKEDKIQNKEVINNVLKFFNKPEGMLLKTALTPLMPEITMPISIAEFLAMKDFKDDGKLLYSRPYENGLFKGNIKITAGNQAVESKSIAEWNKSYNKDNPNGKLKDPKLALSKSAQVNGIEADLDGRYGTKNIAVFGGAKGVLGKAQSKAELNLDLLNGNIGGGAEAKVSAVQGEVKGGVELFGYKVGVKAKGDALSFGGEIKAEVDFQDKNKDGELLDFNVGAFDVVGGSVGVFVEKA